MIRAIVLAATLGACDPTWGVDVEVTDASGDPVAQAVVAVTACDGLERSAAHTDTHGHAALSGAGFGPQEPCLVTVAKSSYRTTQISLTAICGADLDDCGPRVGVDVVLDTLVLRSRDGDQEAGEETDQEAGDQDRELRTITRVRAR